MSTAAIRGVVRQLGLEAEPLSDAALLTRYARHNDHVAFAELLRRYGPVVLGVCRRILADRHAAEDAFQAVFLVLARKADAVRPPGKVGAWLYGVAVRTANKAKVAAARRWRREMVSAMASRERERPESSSERTDLRAVIDDELGRLPESLRAPVVLCDLGGKTRSEAARELGCPEGTVAARLARARKLLADRFTRRGVTLPAAGLGAILCPAAATAVVPPDLAAATLLASRAFAAGVASSTVSPAVQTLAEGMLRTMISGKLKLSLLALLLGGLVTAGGFLWAANGANPAAGTPDPDPPPVVRAEPPVKPAAPAAANPWKERTVLDHNGWLVGSVAYSPDGKTLVVGGTDGHVRAYTADGFKQLWEAKLEGNFSAVAFSHDGKTLAATFQDGVKFLDPTTGKAGEAILRKDSKPMVVGWFPDEAVEGEPKLKRHKIAFDCPTGYFILHWIHWTQIDGYIAAADGDPDKNPRRPVGEVPLAIDPGGQWAVMTSQLRDTPRKYELWANSASPGKGGRGMLGHQATVTSAAWSADGTVIVSGDTDGVVITWDAATFKEKARLSLGGRVVAVAVSADGTHLAAAVVRPTREAGVGTYAEEVSVWRADDPPAKPEPISRHEAGAPFSGLASLAFSPDGKTLAAGFCNFTHLTRLGELVGRVRIWSLEAEAAKPKPKPDK